MTYDLIDDRGNVLFSGYPYVDARAEQRWRWLAGASSLRIVPHGEAKEYRTPPRPCTMPQAGF